MPVEITEATIREIRAGCEGVADGPWETDFLDVCQPKIGFKTIITVRDDGEDQSVLTAEHVARLDPQTVAALCDDWLRMREALAVYGMWAIDVATLGELAALEAHMNKAGVTFQQLNWRLSDDPRPALSQATGKTT